MGGARGRKVDTASGHANFEMGRVGAKIAKTH